MRFIKSITALSFIAFSTGCVITPPPSHAYNQDRYSYDQDRAQPRHPGLIGSALGGAAAITGTALGGAAAITGTALNGAGKVVGQALGSDR